jgi:hypothetical protein
MKYLFILLIALLGFSSCTNTTTVEKIDLPIEIVTLKEFNKYDTLLVINSENKTYLFDNKANYIGAYDKKINPFGVFLFGVVITLMIVAFIGVITS